MSIEAEYDPVPACQAQAFVRDGRWVVEVRHPQHPDAEPLAVADADEAS
ncbi:hypothetical protein [Streptomyces monashensis]|nr:hypothetical protein [Streptomyces monashensis]